MINSMDPCNVVFDSLENGILVVDEYQTVWSWNKWLEINTGIRSESIIGKNLNRFYPEIDYRVLSRKIRTTLRLNTPTFYDASLSNRFITIARNKITTSLLMTMQLQVTISPYIPEKKRVMISIYDISDLHELKITLQQRVNEVAHLNNALMQDQQIIDANLMIVKTDCECNVIEATEAFMKFSGYEKGELMGCPFSKFSLSERAEAEYLSRKETLQKKQKWSGEMEVITKSGKVVWMDAVISPYLDDNHEIVSYTAIYHDITDKKRIELLSVTDPLTKLYNRQKFNDMFEIMLMRRHWGEGRSFGLILIDVDYFKRVNDTFGHQVGDNVLIKVADAMNQTIRDGDILARWGGEEFVVLLPDVDLEQASYVAEKLRRSVEQIDFLEIGTISTSLGVTLYGVGDTQADMIRRADRALYQAKENGRNCVISG